MAVPNTFKNKTGDISLEELDDNFTALDNSITAINTKITLSAWTVIETDGVLCFKYNGVNKMKLDSSGNLSVAGDVIAYETL